MLPTDKRRFFVGYIVIANNTIIKLGSIDNQQYP